MLWARTQVSSRKLVKNEKKWRRYGWLKKRGEVALKSSVASPSASISLIFVVFFIVIVFYCVISKRWKNFVVFIFLGKILWYLLVLAKCLYYR